MEKKIQSFINSEKNLSFCTVINNTPHCVSCFYVLMKEHNYLIFKSDRNTKHISMALMNDKIAGTIVPEKSKTGIIRGVQYTGKFIILKDNMLFEAKKLYYRKFPVGLTIPGDLWAIELQAVKMIDNTLGFGTKLIWEKSAEVHLSEASFIHN